jgi:hypothetical protein
VTPRVPDEALVLEEVQQRLARAQRTLDEMDRTKLVADQREIFASAQDFVTKAREALVLRDLPRAQVLADKAAKLADDLAAATRK